MAGEPRLGLFDKRRVRAQRGSKCCYATPGIAVSGKKVVIEAHGAVVDVVVEIGTAVPPEVTVPESTVPLDTVDVVLVLMLMFVFVLVSMIVMIVFVMVSVIIVMRFSLFLEGFLVQPFLHIQRFTFGSEQTQIE